MLYLTIYAVITLVYVECILWADRRAGNSPTVKQYINLVLLWPLIQLAVWLRRRK